jgi:hypothetical protein
MPCAPTGQSYFSRSGEQRFTNVGSGFIVGNFSMGGNQLLATPWDKYRWSICTWKRFWLGQHA